jgi:predicted nucleic acid-binding protein
MIETGDIEWVCSEAVDLETDKNSDEEKKDRVRQICRKASEYIKLTDGIENRAITLEASGFGAFDAMHLATAESAHAEVLFTTDQKFERLAARRRKNLGVSVVNPLQWVKERCR